MSYFNSNITGGSGGAAGGLVTKFMKTIAISSSALAEVTIDISHDISNYKDITNDNIIIELNNASAIATGDAELSHTYNAETGVITITSTNSNIPFASSSTAELDVNVYVAGAVQIPPTRKTALTVASSGNTATGASQSGSGSQQTFKFVVNVGQVAVLSVGESGSISALNFASGNSANTQGWKISNRNAILGSNRGGANTTSDNRNAALGCLIVMPTEETGAVSISRTGGATTWVGISYIILDINEV